LWLYNTTKKALQNVSEKWVLNNIYPNTGFGTNEISKISCGIHCIRFAEIYQQMEILRVSNTVKGIQIYQ